MLLPLVSVSFDFSLLIFFFLQHKALLKEVLLNDSFSLCDSLARTGANLVIISNKSSASGYFVERTESRKLICSD